MIEAQHIVKRFGKLTALNDLSFTCKKSETIALIGPNGSGKTTFIKALLGLVIPDSGSILYDGVPIRGKYEYRSTLGYMPQIGRYPDNMTIAQLIEMMCDIRGEQQHNTDTELVQSFGLNAIGSKRMRTLSGGTRQKVSAALAFMFHPKVLVLDEPTAGLDPVASEILKEKVRKEQKAGKLILITSHILSDLDDLISEVIYLNEGSLIFHKGIEELRIDTGEYKLSKAIAAIMQGKEKRHEKSY
jgi:Cu-processing system ATP-binding protein